MSGSSPLARGLRGGGAGGRGRPGIIPARAGFTPGGRGLHPDRRDHPRSRGVYAMILALNGVGKGSSPLARGLLTDSTSPRRPTRDHPRSRGVYCGSRRCGPGSWGSSPLARGLLANWFRDTIKPRIIPARAGFTRLRVGPGIPSADHPRSRGVYGAGFHSGEVSVGSSPLARGLHVPEDVPRLAQGIIPARAGFTSGTRGRCARSPDHPRSRGVYALFGPLGDLAGGSSPLARGLPRRVHQ